MITITGLGPGDLDRVPETVMRLLLDPERTLIARTRDHPAAAALARLRKITFCDDLYETRATFEEVYEAIAQRVLDAARSGPVVYVVPGSPLIGEFAVRKLLGSDADIELIPAESFVDAVLTEMDCDPLDRGLQILNGHELPDPLVLDKPTIVGHLDRPEILAEVCAAIARVIDEDAVITVLSGLGTADSRKRTVHPTQVDSSAAGQRTSIFVDVAPGGLIGAVTTMKLLREECPWDREQTHQSLVKNLVEESYELIDAISRLGTGVEPDWVGYAEVESELGDVLLQVLFHAVIARQAGVFDIDGVAEVMRQKLIRRHPHVFGDVEAGSAAEVRENWDRIKETERGDNGPVSALDGVSAGMPGLHRATKIQDRAARVGFDWDQASDVMPKVREELDELSAAMDGDGDVESELGDLLFSVVNLARHLGIDAELVLRAATRRFEDRFRAMEGEGPLAGLDLNDLNDRWEQVKGGS